MLLAFEAHTQTAFAALLGQNNGELRCFQIADPDEITGSDGGGCQKSALGIHERKKRDDASTLHGVGEITLLFGGQPCQSTGKDLSALSDELLEEIDVFVVDGIAGLDRR